MLFILPYLTLNFLCGIVCDLDTQRMLKYVSNIGSGFHTCEQPLLNFKSFSHSKNILYLGKSLIFVYLILMS